jgi:hypothetical protein
MYKDGSYLIIDDDTGIPTALGQFESHGYDFSEICRFSLKRPFGIMDGSHTYSTAA